MSAVGDNQHSLWILCMLVDIVAPEDARKTSSRHTGYNYLRCFEKFELFRQKVKEGNGVIAASEINLTVFVSNRF